MEKPIIGIIGGIGSGKSFIASLFAELGAVVIDSDSQVRQIYDRDDVRRTIREWWGDTAFLSDGSINRKAIALRVFTDDAERRRLEQLIHPLVHEDRRRIMAEKSTEPEVKAFVWDTPLLIETGLHKACDAVIFVEAPWEVRLERVKGRGWDAAELARREKSQLPLDTKREISDYVLSNAADAASARSQVRTLFPTIIEKKSQRI